MDKMSLSPNNATTKQPLSSPGRTQGDGMESENDSSSDALGKKNLKVGSLGDKLIYRPSDLKQYTSTPPVITGKIVNLVPKQITPARKDSSIVLGLKGKEPKFIPYEPYKAAVKPIIPFEKKKNSDLKMPKKSSALLLVPQVRKDNILSKLNDVSVNDDESDEKTWEDERKSFQEEIRKLKEENGQLESQLKFQAQP